MVVSSIEKAQAALSQFTLVDRETMIDELILGSTKYSKFVNEFWTAKQRQSNSVS